MLPGDNDRERRRQENNRALVKAARDGQTSYLRALLADGASADARDDKGWTPLLHASAAGHGDIVQLLLQRGADPNARTSDGLSAATLATAHGHPEIVHMLFDNQR
jgi:ankyrin repeat protein